MPTSEHPYGWLSLVPPLTAIVLAILTKRVVLSLLIGIFFGALVLANWNVPLAVGHMSSDQLWNQLIDSDTLHVFFFTILMGAMVGMINRAAGMRGLVNLLTPFASNRKRGQLTTWFLGLFVFFDDYANTMLLGNTLKPLTDRLKIAREKLAYLVDSTAAPVAGLALVSTWVAGEIGYVQSGLDSLPTEESMSAFGIFVQSIPYRFYVLFALIFVPIVALMGRDMGSMLKAEREALYGKAELPPLESTEAGAEAADIPRDPTAPDSDTPSRWFNAVIPIVVTVGGVVYFLYSSGSANTESNKLMDIFGEASSYSSLLWGALWGAGSAYFLIVIQGLLPFKKLHQAAADGARMMVPALIILWLAQSMSSMTRNQDPEESHRPVVAALVSHGASIDKVLQYVAEEMDLGDQEPAQLLDAVLMFVNAKHQEYVSAIDAAYQQARSKSPDSSLDELRKSLVTKEEEEYQKFLQQTQGAIQSIANNNVFKDFIEKVVADRYDSIKLNRDFEFCQRFQKETERNWNRWQVEVGEGENRQALMNYADPASPVKSFEYRYLHRQGKLYTGDFLSEKLASLREGDNFVANNFVPLLPTMVFVLASIVAFSTGTSWGTMGIVMPLVVPLAYSQLAVDGAVVLESNPILLCCVGSVLAGAIFGDHCSPISDTTVLSSQASGCDHVAHVRTQLPYAILVGLIAIVFGTLPIGYNVPVWFLLPLGIVAMVISLWFFGSKVEESEE